MVTTYDDDDVQECTTKCNVDIRWQRDAKQRAKTMRRRHETTMNDDDDVRRHATIHSEESWYQ